jgi:ABC-type transporter Mla subunit MlaD
VALAIHDERLTRRVGAAVLLLAALMIVFVVVILPRLELGGVDMRIRFGQATGVTEGAAVKISGHVIGHVRNVAIAPDRRDGGIVVEIRIRRDWAARIPINSDFFVDARSVLAPRYIAIGPPPRHADPARPIHDGDEVVGIDPPNLDRILQRAFDNLGELSAFLDALRPATTKLDAATARLTATVRGLATRPGAWQDLDARVAGAIDEARAVFAELQAGHLDPDHIQHLAAAVDGCASRIAAAIDDTRARLAEVRAALALVTARGERIEPQLRAELDHTIDVADGALVTARALTEQVAALARRAIDGPSSLASFATDMDMDDDLKEVGKIIKRGPWRMLPSSPSSSPP